MVIRYRKGMDVYHQFKFVLCLENSRSEDYISEKYDCLVSGILPVYAGTKNIDQYIPEGCYIDYFNYENMDELICDLQNMDEDKYYKYQKSIELYLESDAVQIFLILN